jgi:hypothetical protein
MANQPDHPNDPVPEKPEGEKKKEEKKEGEAPPGSQRVSSSDIDLGEPTWHGDVPAPPLGEKAKRPASVEEDWSSLIPSADSGTLHEKLDELKSDDFMVHDAPEDASILERLDTSQLPSSSVHLRPEDLDDYAVTARDVPLAPKERPEPIEPDEIRATARDLPRPEAPPAAEDADESMPTARDLPRAPEPAPPADSADEIMLTARDVPLAPESPPVEHDADESVTTVRDLPRAPEPEHDADEAMVTARDVPLAPGAPAPVAEEEEEILLSSDEASSPDLALPPHPGAPTSTPSSQEEEILLSSDEAPTPGYLGQTLQQPPSGTDDEEILLSSDEASSPDLALPPQPAAPTSTPSSEDEEIILSSDEAPAPSFAPPGIPQPPPEAESDEEVLLSSDEASSPEVALPPADAAHAATITVEPVQPRQTDPSEEEIDLGALSHEPDDSLAAEFAQLGREGRSPTPSTGSDSAVDLFEEQVLAEGASEVRLGDLPKASGERPSGIDLIAEEVESGVALQSPGQPGQPAPPAAADEDDTGTTFESGAGRPAAQAESDSEVDLGSGESPALQEAEPEADLDEEMTDVVAAAPTRRGPSRPEIDLGSGTRRATAEPGESSVRLDEEPPDIDLDEEEPPRPPARKPVAAAPSPTRHWVGGGLVGAVAGGGVVAGLLWMLGLLNPPAAPTQGQGVRPTPQQPAGETVAKAPSPASVREALTSGRFAEAVKGAEQLPPDAPPEALVARGQARWFNYLQTQMAAKGKLSKDDPQVQQALADLDKAKLAESRYWQGVIEEAAGREDAARKIFEQGKEEFKDDAKARRLFQAALDRLDSRPAAAPKGSGRRDAPAPDARASAERALVLTLIALAQQAAAEEREEAGIKFWEAARLARQGKYADAVKSLREARQNHDTRRFQNLFKAQNPTSDPNEQIFLRCCDLIESYWALEEKLKEYGDSAAILASRKADQEKLTALAREKKDAEEKLREADTRLDAVKTRLKDAGVSDADPGKGVELLADAKKKAESARTALAEALKAAMIPDDDPQKALATLARSKKDLDEVTAKLKAARVPADDPVKGVGQLVSARDSLDATLGKVAQKLEVKPDGVLREVDSMVRQLKSGDANRRIEELRADVRKLNQALSTAQAETQQQRDAAQAAQRRAQQLQAAADAGTQAERTVRAQEAELRQLRSQLSTQRLPGGTAPTGGNDPLLAESYYAAGLVRYYAGDYAAAESDFAEACDLSGLDARHFYYRGLARLAQGKDDLATLDFRLAARLERDGRPDTRAVNASLERVQGSARQTLNRYRP